MKMIYCWLNIAMENGNWNIATYLHLINPVDMEDLYGYNCRCRGCNDYEDYSSDSERDYCWNNGLSICSNVTYAGLRFLHATFPNNIVNVLETACKFSFYIAGGSYDDTRCLEYIKQHFDLNVIYNLKTTILSLDNMKCMSLYDTPPPTLTSDQLRRYHYYRTY